VLHPHYRAIQTNPGRLARPVQGSEVDLVAADRLQSSRTGDGLRNQRFDHLPPNSGIASGKRMINVVQGTFSVKGIEAISRKYIRPGAEPTPLVGEKALNRWNA